MRLNNIKIENYGAIEHLNIDFVSNNEEFQSPTIIVGSNGAGKTLFLSHIVDALIEIKRKKYGKMPEVKDDNYFKNGEKTYIRYGKDYSFVSLSFETDTKNNIKYTDIMTKNIETFINEFKEKEPNLNYNEPKFKEYGFLKEVQGDVGNEIENNILLYFPSTRYSEPSWMNRESNEMRLSRKKTYIGQSSRNIIKENVLKEMEDWILNLVMDKHLYEIKTERIYIQDGNGKTIPIDQLIYLNGRNTNLINMLNNLLTIIYKMKFPKIEFARIGVSSKENRKVSILIKEIDTNEIEVAPTFGHLSSGEAMLISLFGSLLKEYDEITNSKFQSVKEVTGIVLIDEIDLNLHIKFAKEILPDLLKEFPRVQFFLTTHSPFFLLGMDDKFNKEYKIYNLPDGQEIHVGDFQEVQLAYETFINNFSSFQKDFDLLKKQLYRVTKPLLITEGKTDWKHFKGVLNRFKEKGEFVDLDVEFLEYDGQLGLSDDKLNRMLNELSKVNLGKKIIGIFDSDATNGNKYSKERFTSLGNNVFAMSIPTPDFRKDMTGGISVEFLYRNEDLLKRDKEDRRIFLTSEFNVDGRLIENIHIGVRNNNTVKGYLEVNRAKIVDSDVIDIEGKSVALTKNGFAEYILRKEEPFEEVDIEGFRELFNIIQQILQ